MPTIFVDADGCPVKQEIYRVARRYSVHVTLVANTWMRIPEETGFELVIVEGDFDAADNWIVDHVAEGDIVITGSNFGCGSARQQAVDCFAALGVSLIIAKSFGAIYERNAINAGTPIMVADLSGAALEDGVVISQLHPVAAP